MDLNYHIFLFGKVCNNFIFLPCKIPPTGGLANPENAVNRTLKTHERDNIRKIQLEGELAANRILQTSKQIQIMLTTIFQHYSYQFHSPILYDASVQVLNSVLAIVLVIYVMWFVNLLDE